MLLKFCGIAGSYIFLLMITKNFGTEGWGKFSLAISFVMFCILIGKSGFDMALLKFSSANEAKNERFLTREIYFKGIIFCLLISTILTLIILFFSEKIAIILFKKEYMADFLFYSAMLIVLHVVLLVNSEGLRGLKKNNTYLFIQYIGIYLFACLALILFLSFNEGNDILPLQVFIFGSFLVFLMSNYFWLKEIIFVKSEKKAAFPLKDILKVSFPMFVGNAMFVTLNWIDTLLLGVYGIHESEIGIYSAALKVAGIISLPILAVSAILASSVSEQFTLGNKEKLQRIVRDSTRIIFAASLLIYLLYLLFPSLFLGLLGEEFTKGSTVLIIFQMTNHERIFQNIIVGATILNLLLNIILIPYLGITGSAIASLVSSCFWNFTAVYYIKKRLSIKSIFTI
jgi:O-antigen/teichoic acid export membrane protein